MEDRSDYLSIGEFAELSGIKRKTLIYYDQINLLKPRKVSGKGYRYYHYHQLYTVNVIHFFKDIGMSLDEIKEHSKIEQPEEIIELIQRQKEKVQQKQLYYGRMEKMLDLQIESLKENEHFDEQKITIVDYEQVPLFYGEMTYVDEDVPRFSVSNTEFYQQCFAAGYEFPYPSGMCMNVNDKGKMSPVNTRHYIKVPESETFRPKGRYIECYSKGNLKYGREFKKLTQFAEERKLTMIGDVYVDFIQNELVAQNFDDFILKIMIRVK